MKKIMFVQNEGNVVGGVWYVNKTLAEEFVKKGYDVHILSIRTGKEDVQCDSRIKKSFVNNYMSWNLVRKKDVIKPILKFNFISFFKKIFDYFYSKYILKKDYKKMKKIILNEKPDYIIASQYQVLKGIPKAFLKKTVYEHHNSFDSFKRDKDNYKVLKKNNNKIFGFIWLSEAALNKANNDGFRNNFCIYNPVRFVTKNRADVKKNKKLVVISRIENFQKRINLMVKIVNDIFTNKKYKDWNFEIYGVGNFDEETSNTIKKNSQIIYKGSTKDPMNVLLNSSINLNTSLFEGFSLSILEASMCGVPTVTFNHGEAVYEEVLDAKTGFVVSQDNIDDFICKLEFLMDDEDKLVEFSTNAKEYSNKFLVSNIVNKWIKLFEKIDKESL